MTEFKIGDAVFHIATPDKRGIVTDIASLTRDYTEITVRWLPPDALMGLSTHPLVNIRFVHRQAKTHQVRP